jgi:uncharacterized membrane protein YhaH (DUF805 family)
MNWYLNVFRQYADFGGRARRREFWYFVLFNCIAAIVAVIIDAEAGWDMTAYSRSGLPNYGPFYLTYMAAVLLPALAVAVRRLHDLGKSGWWLLIGLIPLVGGIWLIVLYCTEGESGQNRYGDNPKSVKPYFPERRREKSIAIAFIVGSVASLAASTVIWIQHDVLTNMPFQFWLIPVLIVVLRVLFGAFYYPAGDAHKTAERRNIAFVLLAISALIPAIRMIPDLHKMIGDRNVLDMILATNIVWLLADLALLALVVLSLLKSERENIALAAVSTIALVIVSVIILLVKALMFHYPINSFEIVLDIAIILLAVHCLQGKEDDEKS